jgi:hypothetical protein
MSLRVGQKSLTVLSGEPSAAHGVATQGLIVARVGDKTDTLADSAKSVLGGTPPADPFIR